MQAGTLALLAFSHSVRGVAAGRLALARQAAMPALACVLTACIGLFVWEMSFNRVLASTLQGLVIADCGPVDWLARPAVEYAGGVFWAGLRRSVPASPSIGPDLSRPGDHHRLAVRLLHRGRVRFWHAGGDLPRRCWWRSVFRLWPRFAGQCWRRARRKPWCGGHADHHRCQ